MPDPRSLHPGAEIVMGYGGRLDALHWNEVNARFEEMEREGRAILAQAGVDPQKVEMTRTAELRYVGQGHQVTIPAPGGTLDPISASKLKTDFENKYRKLYGRTATGNPLEAINWRVVVSTDAPELGEIDLGVNRTAGAPEEAIKGIRSIYLPEQTGFVDVRVYDRYKLARGVEFAGPAIVEERESTLVIGESPSIRVDEMLNIVVKMPPQTAREI